MESILHGYAADFELGEPSEMPSEMPSVVIDSRRSDMLRTMSHPARLLLALLLLPPAVARADGEPVSISMVTQVPVGKKPTLTIKALARVTNLVLELTHDEDSAKATTKIGSMGAGQTRVVPMGDGAIGPAHWSGTITLKYGAGEAWENSFTVDTVVNAEIRVGYQREHLYLDRHVLEFQISRPSKQLEADLTVYGDQGQIIGQGKQTYEKAAAGKWMAITWEPTEETPVMKMTLHVSDGGGFVDEILTPWSVSIPHEEVNFKTNSFDIEESERPKLDAAYEKILEEVTKAQKLDVRCNLFVSGHTDTVGPRDKNQKLSLDRARSIAAYFRKKGLAIKVSYEGFGEDRLKVRTPDETDEPQNRRADYTLTAEGPPSVGTTFRWKEVK